MSTRRSIYIPVDQHEIHVSEWGDPQAPAVIMWHGLARNGRDFDVAARYFNDRFRIICPDTIGRGLSTWSANPVDEYVIPLYCRHALAVMDALHIDQCQWVGTSMGGIIGMSLAGTPFGAQRISRLVINDVGPQLNQAALDRIKSYAGMVPEFSTVTEYERFLRLVYAPFGTLTDDEWRQMTESSLRRLPNGKLSSHMDPAVMQAFAHHSGEFSLWDIYDAITCPTLLIRGEASDLLDAAVAEQMTQRGPKATAHTIPGCGHAPALNTQAQLSLLDAFLQ